MMIEKHDRFVHKRLSHSCVVEYTSVTGGVGYRIRGQRHTRYSELHNFHKNWKRPEREESEQPSNHQEDRGVK